MTGSRRPAFAVIAIGAVAMAVVAAQPMLSADGPRWPLLAELAAMGLTVLLLGTFHPPRRLRMLGLVAVLAYAAFNFGQAYGLSNLLPGPKPPSEALAAPQALLISKLAKGVVGGPSFVPAPPELSWPQLTAWRALAGVASGAMVWLTVGWIARRERPEPWAAGFFLSQALGGLMFVAVLAVLGPEHLPGHVACALLTLAAIPAALIAPDTREPLAGGPWPPPRGWLGLAALLLYVTGSSGVWYHMGDYAAAAGLGGAPRDQAIVATLVGQIAGAGLAVSLAGKVRFSWLFAGVALLTLGAWMLLLAEPSPAVFVGAFGVSGFAGMALGVSLFSFLIAAEPTRRAAAVSASAQLMGGALGPALSLPLNVCAFLVVASLALVLILVRSQRMALGAGRP